MPQEEVEEREQSPKSRSPERPVTAQKRTIEMNANQLSLTGSEAFKETFVKQQEMYQQFTDSKLNPTRQASV